MWVAACDKVNKNNKQARHKNAYVHTCTHMCIQWDKNICEKTTVNNLKGVKTHTNKITEYNKKFIIIETKRK